VIATGARPGIDLTAPLRVDAWAVGSQIRACEAIGVNRVLLVSSLCSGLWWHALNLFGLILVVKRLGERALESSSLDWTIVRPGGLSELETGLDQEQMIPATAMMTESIGCSCHQHSKEKFHFYLSILHRQTQF
jgi:hypothetical protein